MICLSVPTRRMRRRLALGAVLLALAGSVVWAHSGFGMHEMHADGVMAVCLAVMSSVAVGVALAVPPAPPLPRPREPRPTLPGRAATPMAAPRARDGPAMRQVFRT